MNKRCQTWNEWRNMPGNEDKPATAWREEMIAAGLMRAPGTVSKAEKIEFHRKRANDMAKARHDNSSTRK